MVRLQITLERDEAKKLAEWAESELRQPRDQLRYLLRQELERRGLLLEREHKAQRAGEVQRER